MGVDTTEIKLRFSKCTTVYCPRRPEDDNNRRPDFYGQGDSLQIMALNASNGANFTGSDLKS